MRELDLGLDEMQYTALVERNSAKQQEVLSRFIKQLDEVVHTEHTSRAEHSAEQLK
jgi:hypothetical protein